MRRTCLGLCLGISIGQGASGAEQVGKVNMNGSILEAPCAIAMESLDQTIELKTVPISVLKQWGQGPRHQFIIHIIDCRLQSSTGQMWKTFTMTFDGAAEKYGFSVYGVASGLALQLDDAHGQVVIPGQPLPISELTLGDKRLRYGLRIVSNHSMYTPGDFRSIIHFKLDYY